jgi:hypothetical protein
MSAGLEDQLLVDVIKSERPDLEEKKVGPNKDPPPPNHINPLFYKACLTKNTPLCASR